MDTIKYWLILLKEKTLPQPKNRTGDAFPSSWY
uniref:Uncharacterized protein n=1 Tax=Anguilla anguilla TaxID=7936 RepID=A0A0E9U3R8_ANGAN